MRDKPVRKYSPKSPFNLNLGNKNSLMDFIDPKSSSKSNSDYDTILTKQEFETKMANHRVNLEAKKQNLKSYKKAQESGELFANTQTPLEQLKNEKNFVKVLKIVDRNTLNADPVFVTETMKAVGRTLPIYVSGIKKMNV